MLANNTVNVKTKSYRVFTIIYNKNVIIAGNPYWRGRLSTLDLLVQTSLDQVLLILQTFTLL